MSTSWAARSIRTQAVWRKVSYPYFTRPYKEKATCVTFCYVICCYYMQTIFYEQAHEQNMVLNTRKLLNSYIFKPPCNFCIIFVGSRAWACRSLCRRRWNISLHKKIDGTSLLTSFRDTLSIHKTAVAS